MKKHFREQVTVPPSDSYWRDRFDKGWRLSAIEWERPDEAEQAASLVEVPYGLRIAPDCSGLEEDEREMDVLRIVMAIISDDRPISTAVQALQQKGYRTRDGNAWTPTAVFKLMPRLVEVGPRIMLESDWAVRRQALMKSA